MAAGTKARRVIDPKGAYPDANTGGRFSCFEPEDDVLDRNALHSRRPCFIRIGRHCERQSRLAVRNAKN